MAISADTVVVGADGEDGDASSMADTPNDNARDSGAAYVFVRNGSEWSQQAYLKASNVSRFHSIHFGSSVAIFDNEIVVGAPQETGNEDSTVDNPNFNTPGAGAAYVFIRDGETWSQQKYLKASNAEQHDGFGSSVATSGGLVVVGARGEDGDGSATLANPNDNASGSGAAYVFSRSGMNWTQQGYVKVPNADRLDDFGCSVGVWGDSVIVGARGEDGDNSSSVSASNNNALQAGSSYVFNVNTISANAGDDIDVLDADGDFLASVVLDGSSSFSAEGSIVTWSWSWIGLDGRVQSAAGVRTTEYFPVGLTEV